MATSSRPEDNTPTERTQEDIPPVVVAALAIREELISAGETVPEFDENGFEVVNG